MEESKKKKKRKATTSTLPTTERNDDAPSPSSPDLSTSSGDHWSFLGEGGANVVFSYEGPDPKLAGLVLRLRKKKKETDRPSALDEAVEALVWAPLFGGDARSAATAAAADRDVALARDVVAPLVGRQYVSIPEGALVVPMELRASLERQLAERGTRADRAAPGEDAGAQLEERGALLRDASRWDRESTAHGGPSLCVELKPKCGLPHGEGRRTKVMLKQQLLRPLPKGGRSYCPLDLFSARATRRRTALVSLALGALSRDFSHRLPRAAHFRMFDGGGRPVEGRGRALDAASSLLLPGGTADDGGGDGGRSGGGLRRRARSSPVLPPSLELLVDSLDAILSAEPLLPRLLEAQRCKECPTSSRAAEKLAVLRRELLPETASSRTPSRPPLRSATDEAASSLRSYLTAVTARDLSVMILLRREERREEGPRSRLQTDAFAGGAVEVALRSSSPSSSPSSPRRILLRYRITLADLDAKPVSKVESHAAADAKLPRSGKRRGVEKR